MKIFIRKTSKMLFVSIMLNVLNRELRIGDIVVIGNRSENSGRDWFTYLALSDENRLACYKDKGRFEFASYSSRNNIYLPKNYGKVLSCSPKGYWIEIL